MARLLVNVDVDDLDEAVRFYTTALELRVGRRFGGEGIELVGAEAPIYLLGAAAGSPPFRGATAAREYERHWTPVHLDFAVEDIEVAVERAVSAGAVVEVPIRQHPYGKMAVLADPFGHGFCFLQFGGAATTRWRRALASAPARAGAPSPGLPFPDDAFDVVLEDPQGTRTILP